MLAGTVNGSALQEGRDCSLHWKDPAKKVPFSILLIKTGPRELVFPLPEDLGLGVRLVHWTFAEEG